MNFNIYQEKALRTIKPHASKAEAICDWTLGIMGEISEVQEALLAKNWSVANKMELAKEIGDVVWYLAALTNELDVDLLDVLSDTFDDREIIEVLCMNNMIYTHLWAGRTCEIIKHHVMHKEPLDEAKLRNALYNMVTGLHAICREHGFTLKLAAELNEAKLSHRYDLKNGSKYNEEASKNRHAKENEFKSTPAYLSLVERITGVRQYV